MELLWALLIVDRIEIREPLIPLWAAELSLWVFIYIWLFCMGATVGSFLNVVVYRLPLGKNLAYPGSYCPRCRHPIRLADNIPIVSWLALWGRCRDCGGRIAVRYWVVELVIAILFVLVLLAELYLPAAAVGFGARQPLQSHDGVPFWCMYGLHVVLMTTLIGAALIRSDGFSVPAMLFGPVLLAGLALPLVWPEIHSAPALGNVALGGWQRGLVEGALGLAIGIAVAAVFVLAWQRRRGHWRYFAPLMLGAAVGVVLGWQRTLLWLPVIMLAFGLAVNMLQRIAPAAVEEGPGQTSAELSAGPDEPQPEMPAEEIST